MLSNGQEMAFLACVYNFLFNHVTFADGGSGAKESSQDGILKKSLIYSNSNPPIQRFCHDGYPRNIDVFNSIINAGVIWFSDENGEHDSRTNAGDFDWDYNIYTFDTATQFKHRHQATLKPNGERGLNMAFSDWQNWAADPCGGSCTRDPHSFVVGFQDPNNVKHGTDLLHKHYVWRGSDPASGLPDFDLKDGAPAINKAKSIKPVVSLASSTVKRTAASVKEM